MLLNSVVTALLMASIPSKQVPFIIPLSFVKITRCKIRWIRRFFEYNDVPVVQGLPDNQHTQSGYFSHRRRSSLIIFQTLFLFISTKIEIICTVNSQQTISAYHLPYSTGFDVSPACWRHPASGVIFHFLTSLLNLSYHTKACVCDIMFSLNTCWSISSAYDEIIPDQAKIFGFIRSSLLIDERSENRYEQKCVKKKRVIAESIDKLYTPKVTC